MDKQTRYWLIGIMAVIIAAIVLLVAFSKNKSNTDNNVSDRALESSSSSHEGTMHTSSAIQELSDENLDRYLKDQDMIMDDMMNAMMDIQESGNADIDYLMGMIPHHESAIAMAESYLKNGGEQKELKTIAENIIELQKSEIDQMNSMIEELKANGYQDEDLEDAYLEEYREMFDDSHSNHMSKSTAQNVDAAFAEGMIMHHQMAIDMSEMILNYTNQTQVQNFAQNVVDVQKLEIDQMQKILDNLPNS